MKRGELWTVAGGVYASKTRPVVILTRDAALHAMTKVTVAPITTTAKGLSSEVPLGTVNGLDQRCVASLDNIVTIPKGSLGRSLGFLTTSQEHDLARAMVVAFDLDLAVLFDER